MAALIFGKIPYPDATIPVAADELSLIRVYDHIIHRTSMSIIPLHSSALCVPDLDCPILGRSHHPFRVAVKANASNVASMSFECENGSWVVPFARVELDVLASSSSHEGFVG